MSTPDRFARGGIEVVDDVTAPYVTIKLSPERESPKLLREMTSEERRALLGEWFADALEQIEAMMQELLAQEAA